jgi:thiamine-phosphate pyrophosphorylase
MTDSNLDIAKMAQAIIDTHSARFGLAATVPSAQFFGQASAYRAAKSACMAMNFIEADAECLARAWQAQTERLGRFDATLWPAAPVDFGMQPLPAARRPDAFAPCPRRLGLYAVLPDAKVRGTSALLFINDHWRAAIAAGAYGVHLGQEDLDALSPDELAQIRAAGVRMGVSTHGYAEMVRADAVSPSYIAMGAVFPTTLKRMATAPQGLARLDAYAKLTSQYAQVAIGGIDAERLPAVLATGVGSVAMVRAIIAADDPEAACRELGALVDSATGRRAAH